MRLSVECIRFDPRPDSVAVGVDYDNGDRTVIGSHLLLAVGRRPNADAILGAAILGVDGDEAIHAVLDTMAAGAKSGDLARTMHIHPTVAELIPTVLQEAKP